MLLCLIQREFVILRVCVLCACDFFFSISLNPFAVTSCFCLFGLLKQRKDENVIFFFTLSCVL